MPHLSDHLNDREREALRLAAALRERMTEWMIRRGIPGGVRISPFVDAAGLPSVLVRMNPHLIHAMLRSFDGQGEPREYPNRRSERPEDPPRWPLPPSATVRTHGPNWPFPQVTPVVTTWVVGTLLPG